MGALVRSTKQQMAVAEKAQDQRQYLTFQVGGEVFAIAILGIREILEYHDLTVVPMMPAFIRGVINLRGRVVSVVDLSARFGRAGSEITKRSCIVIIDAESEGERQDIGVVVDMVNAVVEIPASEIEPPPSFGARVRADFISGMGKVGGRFVIILDVNRVLSVEELAMLGEARALAQQGAAGETESAPA